MLNGALTLLTNRHSEVKAIALLRCGIVERTAKRLNEALRLLTDALPLIDTSPNNGLKGKFYNQLATVLENLGRSENREDYIDRSLSEYAE